MNFEQLYILVYNCLHDIGAKKNEKKVFEYYMKAFELVNLVVGLVCTTSCRVDQDYNKAFEYYKKSV
ncbi:10045_t:CDS:1, partial [Cetraspora pellucida]